MLAGNENLKVDHLPDILPSDTGFLMKLYISNTTHYGLLFPHKLKAPSLGWHQPPDLEEVMTQRI